jgi:predicted permease
MLSRSDVLLKEALITLRSLRRERAFAGTSILLLALGIGLTSAVFTLLWQVVYAQLPVPDAAHIYTLTTDLEHMGREDSDAGTSSFSAPTYRYLSTHFTTSSGVIARHGEMVNIETPEGPRHLLSDFVSGNFFDVLGLKPVLGRSILPQNDVFSDDRFVAVLSYSFWQGSFGGQMSAWNSTIRVNGLPFRIIGIAPPSFTGLVSGQAPQIYLPLAAFGLLNPGWHAMNDWSIRWLHVFVRLPENVARIHGEAELGPIYRAAVREELATEGVQPPDYLAELAHERISLVPASQGIHGMLDQWQQPLQVLLWMTVAVLLLTCLNIAGLAVVRAIKQRQEMLVRYALGATRAAVMRLYFIHTLALSVVGGLAALWVARWGATLLLHLGQMDRGGALTVQPSGYTLGLHWAAVVLAGFLVGLVPAWYGARVDLANGLRETAATHSSGRSHVFGRRGLAAMQIALSLVLLIAAGLFAKSLHNLISVPVGFSPDHLTIFSIDPKISGSTVEGTEVLYSRIENRLKGTPGVAAVTYGTGGPFPQSADVAVMTPGSKFSHTKHQSGIRSIIGPDYFRTLAIRVIAGREFNDRDRPNTPNGVIINETLAHKLFGTSNPIGQTVAMFNGLDPNWLATIIGVAEDYHVSWKRSNAPLLYTSAQQERRISDMTFYVRTRTGFSLTEQNIRDLVRSEAPSLAAYDVQTMATRMENFASGERAMTLLTGFFAALALVIAVVGIYGVVAYTSSLRTAEFGVRISVGAQQADIILLIVREAALIVTGGLILALPLGWLGLSLIRTQLYGMTFYQPLLYLTAICVLTGCSFMAALIPARRATRMNVQAALRYY